MNEKERRLTARRLRQILRYDPATGIFVWLISPRSSVPLGSVAGTKAGDYVGIGIGRKIYRAHRLAWLYIKGRWPQGDMDHRDLDKQNNRWTNLRPAANGENARNVPRYANNTSGVKGVCWHKKAGKWVARIQVNKKMLNLGVFDEKEQAAAAYRAAAYRHHGEFARVS